MKKWPPFGTSDGTPWTNGNPAVGQRGSVIDARAIDHAQTEIVNAITRLGLTPDANNLEQLGLAIQNAIDAATGGGSADGYVTVESARARLPIFPEVLTADGRLTITSPSSGTVLVAPTGILRHRGIFDVNMSDIAEVNRTFSVLPSRVAHLRWSPSAGLSLRYLDDPLYNASSSSEASDRFDSSYDDVLLARIITNSSAVPAITSLVNKHNLMTLGIQGKTVTRTTTANFGLYVVPFDPIVLNWARTPKYTASASRNGYGSALTKIPEEVALQFTGSFTDETGTAAASVDRYSMNIVGTVDTNVYQTFEFSFQLGYTAIAQ